MPPTECHSPAVGQPAPAADAPPPGRAWKRCQMKRRPLRGSRPAIAKRKRRPQPPMTRSGHAGARAEMMASTISLLGWLVQSVTAAPSRAQTTVPSSMRTVSGRKAPSLRAVSGSSR